MNDFEVIINNENVECEFENNVLKYYENANTLNTIDLNNNIYIRTSNEFTFKIDFNNKIFDYILISEDLKIIGAKLTAELIQKDNIISLKYNLGDGQKQIIIHLL